MLLYEIYNYMTNKLHLIFNRFIKYYITNYINEEMINTNFTINLMNQKNHFVIRINNLILKKKNKVTLVKLPIHAEKIVIKDIDILFPKNFYLFNNCKILISNVKFNISEKKDLLTSNIEKEITIPEFNEQIISFLHHNDKIESIKIIEELFKYLYYHLNIHVKKITIKDKNNGTKIKCNVCINKGIDVYNFKIYNFNLEYKNNIIVSIPSLFISLSKNIKIHISNTEINIDDNKNQTKHISNIIEKYNLFNSEGRQNFKIIFDTMKINYNYTHKLSTTVSNLIIKNDNISIGDVKISLYFNNIIIPLIKTTNISVLVVNKISTKIQTLKFFIYTNLINKVIPIFYNLYFLLKNKGNGRLKNISEKCISEIIISLEKCNIYLLDVNLDDNKLKSKFNEIFNKNTQNNNIKFELNYLKYHQKIFSNGKKKLFAELDNIVIYDNIQKSLWNKFCFNSGEKKCLKLKIFQLNKHNKNIYNILIALDSITFNIDQKCLLLIYENIQSNIPTIINNPGSVSNIIIENFVMKTFTLTISYKPDKINLKDALNGDTKQIVQLGNVYDKEIIISKIYLKNIESLSYLMDAIFKIILHDVKDKNLIKYLKSIEPLNHFFNIYSHFKHLLVDPMKNNGHNVFYRIGKSSFKFAKNVSYEFMDISSKIISGTQTGLENITNHKVKKYDKSNFSDCPKNIYQGVKQGFQNTSERIQLIRNEDLSLKSKIIQPVIGITELTNKTITGMKNQIKPESYKKMKDRYG